MVEYRETLKVNEKQQEDAIAISAKVEAHQKVS